MNIKIAKSVLGTGFSSWNDHHGSTPDGKWRVTAAQEDAANTQNAYWTLRALKEGLIKEDNDG